MGAIKPALVKQISLRFRAQKDNRHQRFLTETGNRLFLEQSVPPSNKAAEVIPDHLPRFVGSASNPTRGCMSVSKPRRVVNNQGIVLDPHLRDLILTLRHTAPQPRLLVSLNESQAPLTKAQFETTRDHRPELFTQLSSTALKALVKYLLSSRSDSFTIALLTDIQGPSSIFTRTQRSDIFRSLIQLSRTKRKWLSEEFKEFGLISDGAVAHYFNCLLDLIGVDLEHGLKAEDIRSVIRALRRSSHPLFWNAPLISRLWHEMIKDQSNSNRLDVHARLGVRCIIHWISYPPPDQIVSGKPIWSLTLEIWSQLVDWGQILTGDVAGGSTGVSKDTPSVDQAVLTVLGSIIRSGIRRYSTHPLNRDNAKLFKNSCEALARLLDRHALAKTAMAEALVQELIHAYLQAVAVDLRAPAPAVMAILLRFPHLPTVSDRWTREGISEADYELYRMALASIHSLGRASLLVDVWLSLLPQINLAKAGWPLSRVFSALEELANPLVRSDSGQPLNPFRYARLVLQVVKALEPEFDDRLEPNRRLAFRLLVEPRAIHRFDWLRRGERQFDKDGLELESMSSPSPDLPDNNIETLYRLWKSSWGVHRRVPNVKEDETLPLASLIGVTRLVQAIRTSLTIDLLKRVVTRFVSDRTPALDEHQVRSKYLYNPRVKLTDQERTQLIESHMTIGGELSRKFTAELFESFQKDKVVPSVEDMRLMNGFLQQIDKDLGKVYWREQALRVRGLPWDLSGTKGWEVEKVKIAQGVFGSLIEKKGEKHGLNRRS